MVTMKHTLAVFLLLGATCAAAATMPASARAHDLRSSLTAGHEQCAAPVADVDVLDTDTLDTDMDINDLELRRAKSKKCYWAGTAPFCMGVCRPGDVLVRRSAFGDGARCWTGTKAYCCPPGGANGPGKSTDPDDDDDKGWRTSTSAVGSKTQKSGPKTSTKAGTTAPKATAPITTPDRSQVPLPGRNPAAPKGPAVPKKSSQKQTSRKSSSKKTQPPPEQEPLQRKQAPPGGHLTEDSPKGPKRPGQGSKSPGQRPIANSQPSGSDSGVHDDDEDENGFMETAKDILAGFKELNKLNFMGHFGEFGAIEEIEEEHNGEEHPEHT